MTDNQFQELFRLVTTAVTSINDVKLDVKELNGKVDGLEQRFDGLEQKVDNLQTDFHEFRVETRENFQRLERQLEKDVKSLNKRDADRERKMADVRVDLDELDERVKILEEREAA